MTTIQYHVGDFLIRVKNASLAGKAEVRVPQTKFVKSVAALLKKEGYLNDIKSEEGDLIVRLSFQHKTPVLSGLKLVSKPGLKVYMKKDEIAARRGISKLIISTSKGVVSSQEAIKNGLGGQVIAEIW